MGAKKRPFYRIVVADGRTARGGRFIEQLGYYDPITDPPTLKIDQEKAKLWLSRGAQPTDTARALLKKAGAIEAPQAVVEPKQEQEEPKPVKRTRKAAAKPAPESE